MGVHELFLDMQVSLLSSEDGGDAIRLAAVLAEAVLKELLAHDPQSKAGLGELIGEVHGKAELRERLGRALIIDANWLNERRKTSVHFKGKFEKASVDDGKRSADIAAQLLERGGLCTRTDLDRLIKEAEWKASTPAETAVLKLDRTSQRAELDDLLALPLRISVLVLDGEVGQGHEHFGQVMQWRLRAIPKGQWREVKLAWPEPSESTGTRFAQLIEHLNLQVGAGAALPIDVDPLAEAGRAAWNGALTEIGERLARSRVRLCIRHSIGWPADGDAIIIQHYLERLWAPVADRPGERIVLAFELQRAPASGMPLGKAWRVSRRERRVATGIAASVEDMRMPEACRCSALDELTSVSRDDLVQWFRNERNQPRTAAEREADAVLTATQGGRFELVVKRIASLARGSLR